MRQKTGDMRQKTEDRRQETEDRRQETEENNTSVSIWFQVPLLLCGELKWRCFWYLHLPKKNAAE
jgi:hypothetical protein